MFFGAILKPASIGRLLALGLVLVSLAPTSDCAAQPEWRRTVKVIAPINEGSITRALADTVVTMAENHAFPLRRAPKADTTSLASIRETLSGNGLALTSATHVFITYRYELREGNLHRDIRNLHFIYRPTAQQGEDIPILYVDLTKDDLYDELLVDKGTPSPINEVAFNSFEEQIDFHDMQESVTVVQVGKEIIRNSERASSMKRRILDTVEKLTYAN